MKPRAIGIVGGAGPMAGLLLSERIFSLASSLYRCQKDRDFPQVTLISYPFSEMLSFASEEPLTKELDSVLITLKQTGAEVLAIACNTIHAFLANKDYPSLIHMPEITKKAMRGRKAIVLCTTTSMQKGIHKPCVYPDRATQGRIDLLIDQVLKGVNRSVCSKELLRIVKSLDDQECSVVLGCTELSLIKDALTPLKREIIDPLAIVAMEIVIQSFKGELI